MEFRMWIYLLKKTIPLGFITSLMQMVTLFFLIRKMDIKDY